MYIHSLMNPEARQVMPESLQRIESFVKNPEFRVGNPGYMAAADTIELTSIRESLTERTSIMSVARSSGEVIHPGSQQDYDMLIARESGIYTLIHERATSIPGY